MASLVSTHEVVTTVALPVGTCAPWCDCDYAHSYDMYLTRPQQATAAMGATGVQCHGGSLQWQLALLT